MERTFSFLHHTSCRMPDAQISKSDIRLVYTIEYRRSKLSIPGPMDEPESTIPIELRLSRQLALVRRCRTLMRQAIRRSCFPGTGRMEALTQGRASSMIRRLVSPPCLALHEQISTCKNSSAMLRRRHDLILPFAVEHHNRVLERHHEAVSGTPSSQMAAS